MILFMKVWTVFAFCVCVFFKLTSLSMLSFNGGTACAASVISDTSGTTPAATSGAASGATSEVTSEVTSGATFGATSEAKDVQRLVIGVEDKDWNGHYYWGDGVLKGGDADIVRKAARKIGFEVEFIPYPWSRVMYLAEIGQIDGVLDLAPTEKRKQFLYYVQTPISRESVVFWVKKGNDFSFNGTLAPDFTLGLMRGYDWSDRFIMHGTPKVVRFDSYERAFKNLASGRIDSFGSYLRPTQKLVNKLGYADELVPSFPALQNLEYYLALTQKAGHRELADAFSDVLKTLFETEYKHVSPLKTPPARPLTK